MRLTVPRAVGLLLAALALAFLLVAAGLAPVRASAGHWGITRWLLEFAMERAVATRSMGVDAPPLDDPALVLRGAGHFEGGCRPCHGVPWAPRPVIPAHMTPRPPPLGQRASEWDDDELFFIVKHGIKFTGMPAWPAQKRDDEIWAVVAFLGVLPGLDEAGYQALVFGDAAPAGAPDLVVERCARCHGADGLGRGAFPRLAGQRVAYLEASLAAFAEGERHSGIMQPIAADLRDDEMAALAAYYGELPRWVAPVEPALADAVRRGEVIATQGIRGQLVPSCVDCHGPKGAPRNPLYPELAGQDPAYLAQQLELFNQGRRGGTAYASVMTTVAAHALEPAQAHDVALYYATLPME